MRVPVAYVFDPYIDAAVIITISWIRSGKKDEMATKRTETLWYNSKDGFRQQYLSNNA